ncbi:hypothetical protein WJX72_011471 [[Myrmecia] bisecta]|uniref:F-box domain-containing protein n=1 Tax=[Myrmecia] bisecta TaxID=41462 RepID=A0AAW1QCI4_9CHLO
MATIPVRRNIKLRKDAAENWLCRSRKRRALLTSSEELGEAPPCTIDALPSDLLVQIFKHLDQSTCRRVLPRVCHSWHDLLRKPTALWNHVDIDIAAENEVVEVIQPLQIAKVRSQQITTWLVPRAAAVKSLRLLGAPLPEARDATRSSAAYPAIAAMQNLRVLSLKGIRAALGEADMQAISGLKQLRELVLDCDQPPEVEAGSPEVKWGLQSFPERLSELSNMTHMTLSCHYGVTQLPTHISKLNKLQVLNLDFCTLSALPPSLGKLTKLTTLDVEGNLYLGDHYRPNEPGEESFPAELMHLKALKYLNINSCGLTKLPSVIATLRNLETLDMEDNEFGSAPSPDCGLPSGLVELTRLQCLNVAACKLNHVPPVVERLASLRILDLTNNRLTNDGLPNGLSRLLNLKAIGLKRNCLTSVPRVLGKVPSLQEIYLEDNQDMEVKEVLDFIVNLPALRVVMMGKQEGSWSPHSMHFMMDFASKLKMRHPTQNILRISYPGEDRAPKEDESL